MYVNPAFSKSICTQIKEDFKLPDDIIDIVKRYNSHNENFKMEYRTQNCFSKEIENTLNSFNLDFEVFSNKTILDICAGQGYISYHLLKNNVNVRELFLVDINENELKCAKSLILNNKANVSSLKFDSADITNTNYPDGYFDIVIGNSFLHHMYDVSKTLLEIKRIMKTGGIFICLHEPAISSQVFEYRNPLRFLKYLFFGENFLEKIRYKEKGIKKGGGTDVWIFNKFKLKELLSEAGFKNVKVKQGKLFRSIFTSYFKLHLNDSKTTLNKTESNIFELALFADKYLGAIIPDWIKPSIKFYCQK